MSIGTLIFLLMIVGSLVAMLARHHGCQSHEGGHPAAERQHHGGEPLLDRPAGSSQPNEATAQAGRHRGC